MGVCPLLLFRALLNLVARYPDTIKKLAKLAPEKEAV